jgi:hypothetical protein
VAGPIITSHNWAGLIGPVPDARRSLGQQRRGGHAPAVEIRPYSQDDHHHWCLCAAHSSVMNTGLSISVWHSVKVSSNWPVISTTHADLGVSNCFPLVTAVAHNASKVCGSSTTAAVLPGRRPAGTVTRVAMSANGVCNRSGGDHPPDARRARPREPAPGLIWRPAPRTYPPSKGRPPLPHPAPGSGFPLPILCRRSPYNTPAQDNTSLKRRTRPLRPCLPTRFPVDSSVGNRKPSNQQKIRYTFAVVKGRRHPGDTQPGMFQPQSFRQAAPDIVEATPMWCACANRLRSRPFQLYSYPGQGSVQAARARLNLARGS